MKTWLACCMYRLTWAKASTTLLLQVGPPKQILHFMKLFLYTQHKTNKPAWNKILNFHLLISSPLEEMFWEKAIPIWQMEWKKFRLSDSVTDPKQATTNMQVCGDTTANSWRQATNKSSATRKVSHWPQMLTVDVVDVPEEEARHVGKKGSCIQYHAGLVPVLPVNMETIMDYIQRAHGLSQAVWKYTSRPISHVIMVTSITQVYTG